MPTQPRIAMGGFLHETNTFASVPATMQAFMEGGGSTPIARGEAIFAMAGINVAIGGFIQAAAGLGLDLVPTLWCAAIPSAMVERDTYEALAGEILAGLEAAMPLDGVYLDLHGAMAAEHAPDGEGELIRRVRRLIGADTPFVVSLDLHANVSAAMVEGTDALIAYRTYPHVDMATTGRRAAEHMALLLREGSGRFFKAFRQLDFLIPISWQCTDLEPARGLYAALGRLEGRNVPSLSFTPGFPAADVQDCGPAIMAYGRSQAAADGAADRLMSLVAAAEPAFAGEILAPEAAVREAMRVAGAVSGPIVIADTQDNPGAGGESDTMGMAKALVALGADEAAIGLIVDPAAAAAAHAAGEGATIELALGGRSGVPGDSPLTASFTVERLSSGGFTAEGPYFGGARMQLGLSAALRLGGVRLVVASRKAQLADRAMFRFVGIAPEAQKILVVKSSVHFRADFAPIAAQIMVAAAPGPMPADPATLPWRHLRPGVRLKPGGQAFRPAA